MLSHNDLKTGSLSLKMTGLSEVQTFSVLKSDGPNVNQKVQDLQLGEFLYIGLVTAKNMGIL